MIVIIESLKKPSFRDIVIQSPKTISWKEKCHPRNEWLLFPLSGMINLPASEGV
jgi:hypothetical protein